MNKIQYIELLKLRGVVKLLEGESIAAAIKRTGGEPTESEMVKVNEAAMNYFIHEYNATKEEMEKVKVDLKEAQIDLKWLEALEAAGVDNWAGYDSAKEILNNG